MERGDHAVWKDNGGRVDQKGSFRTLKYPSKLTFSLLAVPTGHIVVVNGGKTGIAGCVSVFSASPYTNELTLRAVM
jgi:hypothetical protein